MVLSEVLRIEVEIRMFRFVHNPHWRWWKFWMTKEKRELMDDPIEYFSNDIT